MKQFISKSVFFPIGFLFATTMAVQAHLPFIAPQSYVVDGNSTSVLAGFAEIPFASEVALRGFSVHLTTPEKTITPLTLNSNKAIAIADIETKTAGTYRIDATRDNTLEYVQVGKKWLRVMDSKASDLKPLAERNFILPSEITAKMKKVTHIRHEQLLTFFSKEKISNEVLTPNSDGLAVAFSQHPNTLQHGQTLTLSLSAQAKAQAGLEVITVKQLTHVDEKEVELKQTTDQKGNVVLAFPQSGQYFIQINSPTVADTVQPAAQSYRLHLAVQVN